MKRIHGVAVAFALACVPSLSEAQRYANDNGYYDDRAPPVEAEAFAYDDQEQGYYDERGYEDERYADPRYADPRAQQRYADPRADQRYAQQRPDDRYDPRYDERSDPRYDERYDPRYDQQRHDPRHDERYAHQGHGYEGNCNPRTDHVTPVIGFIIGGLLGNQFGHGAGRAAATGAGASLGHAVATQAVNNCADRYAAHAPPVQMGVSYYGGGGDYHGHGGSGYSLFLGTALPFAYGAYGGGGYGYGGGGYGGGYWAAPRPWRWQGHGRY
jgi:hypothetical protein